MEMHDMKRVLSIAGSDSGGGAGIQADIKTITVHGMFAMTAVTALTAQNTTGVYDVMDAGPDFVRKQIQCVFDDIRPDAVKIGMVSNSDIISAIGDELVKYKAENVVVDPVMVATSGGCLMKDGAATAMEEILFPLASVITPNIPEAEVLADMKIESREDMLLAAEKLAAGRDFAVLVKGGHMEDHADDLLWVSGKEPVWLRSPHIDNPNTHGTGCTLSSAIACGLADGLSVEDSVRRAKEFITGAIADGLNLGRGGGPLNHMYRL